MAVNLSPVGGVAAQFFDNNGVILSGGKIYTYSAGTTTNQTTYTSAAGTSAHTNPIILDSAGRVPSGEIWLTDGLQYKFVLKNANDVTIGTYDNIIGINSNFVNFVTETEVQTATAGQTVFTLTTMQYQPGTNNLTVYVDGVNQIDGGSYSYVETSSTVVTFTAGLHVGALVKFTTAQTLSTGVTDASLVTYEPPFTNSVVTNVEYKLAQTVSVIDFGASSSATAAANLAAFKSAIAAVSIGGTLIVPAQPSFYSIDTTGGLSTAIEVDKRMNIVFEGDVKSNFGTQQANPPYIFSVTADDVTFTGGGGKIIGNGTIDDTNTGNQNTFPGLVHVTGDNFTMNGGIIDTPPKVGVLLYDCTGAKILGNTFTGGPTVSTFGNTAHFAIYSYLGGEHNISDNLFTPDTSGGMYINAIFFNGTDDSIIDANVCVHPYEKLAYIVGSHNLITNNYVVGNPNQIPGTSPAISGTLTSVFRGMGNFNKFSNNVSRYCLAGCTIMDGYGNEVSSNSFIDCGQIGVAVFASSGYTGTFNGTVITNNVITGATIPGITIGNGIYVYVASATTTNVMITNNHVSYFCDTAADGMIFVAALAPYSITFSKISGNRLKGGSIGQYGILLTRVVDTMVSDNYIEDCLQYAMYENGGARNSYLNNKSMSVANIGIFGLNTASANCQQNQYTAAPLLGTVTLANTVTNTVTHGGVAPNARIFLQTGEDTAGVLIVSKGWPTTAPVGNNFTIKMANGTAPGITTAQFFYNIIQ